ncbi:hypothetical protein GIB67_029518 [Kingdonia uniflora]|uniref:hAT-like transposase RNase-H fold domain-containing protein n=1 Tax=Kingdonia uniflora TaxID=39325 RepID=A0A7J7NYC9_9MAGN|nr:hypothetical protein GIB67_029518 [Kingdonia uniflora]
MILDPRFKIKLAEYSYSIIYGNDGEIHITRIRNGLANLYSDYYSNSTSYHSNPIFEDGNTSSSMCDMNSIIVDKFKGFDTWYNSANSSNMHQKSGLDLYLEEPIFLRV